MFVRGPGSGSIDFHAIQYTTRDAKNHWQNEGVDVLRTNVKATLTLAVITIKSNWDDRR